MRAGSHDRGCVIRDLAVMLADGGDCLADLRAVGDRAGLFGPTVFRVIDRIASEPGLLDAVRSAHATARARFWELGGAPEGLTVDVDATLITAHSEKEQAAPPAHRHNPHTSLLSISQSSHPTSPTARSGLGPVRA